MTMSSSWSSLPAAIRASSASASAWVCGAVGIVDASSAFACVAPSRLTRPTAANRYFMRAPGASVTDGQQATARPGTATAATPAAGAALDRDLAGDLHVVDRGGAAAVDRGPIGIDLDERRAADRGDERR